MHKISIVGRVYVIGLTCLLAMTGALPGALPGGLGASMAQAADVALVIGNADYRRAPKVRTAEADAHLIADALSDGGYDVILGTNLDRRDLRTYLSRFARKLNGADRAVIYYSGHAIRSGGRTYLTATDQRNTSLVPVMMDGVPLDLILRLASTRAGRAVVFLDAAQFDGYKPNAVSEPGLATFDVPNGVLVVSAAAPGRAIRRRGSGPSRFARAVEDEFLRPDRRAMRAAGRIDRPAWTGGSVRRDLRLVRQISDQDYNQDDDQGSGGTTTTPSVNTPSSADIEAQLNLTRAQRREVQEILSLLGHDPRGIDGLFGPGSRTAIRLWQRNNGKTETGYLDAEQHTLLLQQRRRAGPNRDDNAWERAVSRGNGDAYRDYLVEFPNGAHTDAARDALKRMARAGSDDLARRERRRWREAREDDRVASYRAYIDRYPYGIWKPNAEQRIAELGGQDNRQDDQQYGTNDGRDPGAIEQALNLTRNDRLSVEQRLNHLGFPPGAQDGFFDTSTRWAIEGYQRNRGFESTGYLSRPVLSKLVEETGGGTGIVIDGATVLRNLLRGLGE